MQKIYPENFEVKIGFDRIREMLQAKCLSNMGVEWVDEMLFQDSFENIQNQLGETDEFCRIVREFDSFPASHFYDLRSALQRIRIEGRFPRNHGVIRFKTIAGIGQGYRIFF
jgi:DNA mismatch repair protein MutS2